MQRTTTTRIIETWRLLGCHNPAPIMLRGTYPLTQRAGRLSVSQDVNTRVSSVRLAFGWQKRGLAIDDPEIVAAKSQAGAKGILIPGKFGNVDVFKCQLADGTEFGMVPNSESGLLDGRSKGTVQVHPSQAYSMLFVFDPVTETPLTGDSQADDSRTGAQASEEEPDVENINRDDALAPVNIEHSLSNQLTGGCQGG